jgi:hypothetical protein
MLLWVLYRYVAGSALGEHAKAKPTVEVNERKGKIAYSANKNAPPIQIQRGEYVVQDAD